MKKVNVALVGAGYIADYHARGLQSLADVEIVSVVGLPLESAKEFAKKYGIEDPLDFYNDFFLNKEDGFSFRYIFGAFFSTLLILLLTI